MQRALEESQASKRKLRQRALAERLDRRRQEKINAAIAAAESAEVQQKVRTARTAVIVSELAPGK